MTCRGWMTWTLLSATTRRLSSMMQLMWRLLPALLLTISTQSNQRWHYVSTGIPYVHTLHITRVIRFTSHSAKAPWGDHFDMYYIHTTGLLFSIKSGTSLSSLSIEASVLRAPFLAPNYIATYTLFISVVRKPPYLGHLRMWSQCVF